MKFKKASPLKGEVHIPGDKSISHRSVMFGSIAKGTTQISHFLQGADCLSTISCFQKMGAWPSKITAIPSSSAAMGCEA